MGQKQQSSYTLNWFTYGLNIAKLNTFWNKLIKSKRQKCKSYDTLAGAADDYFMLSKFISFLCNYCWTFPSNYNLSDEKINFGFAVTQELNQLKKKKKIVKSLEIKEFLKMSRRFIISKIKKLSEKSSLNSSFFRGFIVFDPKILFKSAKQELFDCLKILVVEYNSSKILTSQQCDAALSQFNGVMENEVKELKRDSFKLNHQNDSLDDFYFQHAYVPNYKEL